MSSTFEPELVELMFLADLAVMESWLSQMQKFPRKAKRKMIASQAAAISWASR